MSDEAATRECDGTSTCKVTPKPGAACDDGNPCTKGDVRNSAGTCVGTPYTCDVGACTTASTCDGQGGCIPTAKADGTACDADSSKCTPHDRCQGGVLRARSEPGDVREARLQHGHVQPDDRQLRLRSDDGDTCGVTGCFTMGTCNNGVCSGAPRDCSSFDGPCTIGICDARTRRLRSGVQVERHHVRSRRPVRGGRRVRVRHLRAAARGVPGAQRVVQGRGVHAVERQLLRDEPPAGTTCDPKTSCMGPGLCDDQGGCVGSPAANGDTCALTGGSLGLCLGGSCITIDDLPDAGTTTDASPDAGTAPEGGRRLWLRRRVRWRGRPVAGRGRGGDDPRGDGAPPSTGSRREARDAPAEGAISSAYGQAYGRRPRGDAGSVRDSCSGSSSSNTPGHGRERHAGKPAATRRVRPGPAAGGGHGRRRGRRGHDRRRWQRGQRPVPRERTARGSGRHDGRRGHVAALARPAARDAAARPARAGGSGWRRRAARAPRAAPARAARAGDPCATALFCDDFESYTAGNAPGAPWTRQVSSGSTAAVDTAQARSGTKSVKFVAASGSGSKTAYIRLASTATKTIFPVTPNVVYGRMMFRLEAAPDRRRALDLPRGLAARSRARAITRSTATAGSTRS